MIGLVFVDTLALSARQHLALGGHMIFCLWAATSPSSLQKNSSRFWLSGCCSALLFIGFAGETITRDSSLLFHSLRSLSQYSWHQYLSAFAQYDYVKFQPPFLTFCLSRWPNFVGQQLFAAILLWGGLLVLVSIYGDTAYYIAATPVYALVLIQPGTDTWMFWWMVCVMGAIAHRRLRTAAALYGIAVLIKPLVLILFPFLWWRLRRHIFWSVCLMGAYSLWAHTWYFGQIQERFLLRQSMTTQIHRSITQIQRSKESALWRAFRWRWKHLGKPACLGLWWYACPVYTMRCQSVESMSCCLIILLGFGNIKYLILAFLLMPFAKNTKTGR